MKTTANEMDEQRNDTDMPVKDPTKLISSERHIPVLLHEIVDSLALRPNAIVVDCNLGDGGHSEVIIESLGGNVTILGFDLDTDAIARTKIFLDKSLGKNSASLIPINANFSQMDEELAKRNISEVDAVLFDLGLSTYDLIGSEKGFTFRKDEPLHMTFGPNDAHLFNASDIVNGWEAEDIANVIYAYGEDPKARQIAKAIVEYRKNKPIETSKELADLIEAKFGKPKIFRKDGSIANKTHPATRVFQALRIAVNNELEHLKVALEKAFKLLKVGGKMAIISYHSLEDRITKQITKQWVRDDLARELTKKPIVPGEEELKMNPRSRSAKLRIIEKMQ